MHFHVDVFLILLDIYLVVVFLGHMLSPNNSFVELPNHFFQVAESLIFYFKEYLSPQFSVVARGIFVVACKLLVVACGI